MTSELAGQALEKPVLSVVVFRSKKRHHPKEKNSKADTVKATGYNKLIARRRSDDKKYPKAASALNSRGQRVELPLVRCVSGQCSLLGHMSGSERQLFLSRCTKVSFKRGETIFMQGTQHKTDALVTSGAIRSYYISPSGKEITLAYWSPGDLLGGPDFFDEQAIHLWSQQATQDSTVLLIRGHDLAALTLEIPALARAIIETLMFKLRWFSIFVQTLSTGSVDVRIAHLLIQLGTMFGEKLPKGEIVINQHFTQEDLGSMVGATRQWVNSSLNRLCRSGILRMGKRQVVIADVQRLRSIAQI